MHKAFAIGTGALAALHFGVMSGCATHRAHYSDAVTQTGPSASGYSRIVLLRPNDRFDNYSLSGAVIRVNDRQLGKLAYGGFLLVDVPEDDVVISASARNRWYGTCELKLQVNAGDTVYVDVAPRPTNVAADVAGAVVGAAVVGDAPTQAGVDALLVDETTAHAAAASAVGGATASAIEGAGKECGGPFRLKPLDASVALEKLDKLSWSR